MPTQMHIRTSNECIAQTHSVTHTYTAAENFGKCFVALRAPMSIDSKRNAIMIWRNCFKISNCFGKYCSGLEQFTNLHLDKEICVCVCVRGERRVSVVRRSVSLAKKHYLSIRHVIQNKNRGRIEQ